jgi:Chalcone isomerase-like
MRRLIFIFMMCVTAHSYAVEISGVKLEDKLQLDTHQLVLSGAGIRAKFFVHVYAAALYLGEKAHTAEAVLADSGAKRMSFHLMRDVSGRQVLDGINEAILPNSSEEEMKALESRLYAFEKIFTSVPEIKKGETVNLDYIPGLGTRVTVNGADKGHIAGEDFYRALLKIWVGRKPVQASLKKHLLGGE